MIIDFSRIENHIKRIKQAKANIITAINKLGANISVDSKMDEISVNVEDTVSEAVDDGNLIAENIKKDVTILGVTGTYEGNGGGGTLNTCTIKIINECISNGHGIIQYGFTCLTNGEINVVVYDGERIKDTEMTFDNVICGSVFYVEHMGYSFAAPYCENGTSPATLFN